MAKQTNTYPDWAEKFRAKGKTIRKVKDGYALYECTSVYVKGSYPKSKQKYLGMITEKDGFIPKKTEEGAVYIEYGLSRMLYLNFKREIMRHVFQCTDELVRLGIIAYVFGKPDESFFRYSYLTYADADRYAEISQKIPEHRIETIKKLIEENLKKKMSNDRERDRVKKLLVLCVIEAGPRSVRRPEIPETVKESLNNATLKIPD